MRKIIQIAVAGVENNCGTQCNYVTVALCDDGTVWDMRDGAPACWSRYPDIPQDATTSTEKQEK